MSRLRQHLSPLLGVMALVLGAAYYALSQVGAAPAEGPPVFYPAVMLYNYTAAPLAITILLVAITLAALWIPQVARRLPRYRQNGLAAGAALIGMALACASNVPQWFTVYRHLDRAELNGQVYQLGVRLEQAESAYVVCGCDGLGVSCRCRSFPAAGLAEVTEPPELAADPAANALLIRVGSQVVVTVPP